MNIETERKLSVYEAREILANAPGVKLVDDPLKNQYPCRSTPPARTSPWWAASGKDFSIDNGLNLWVVADNIRKGAATNAVQIAEILIRDYLKK